MNPFFNTQWLEASANKMVEVIIKNKSKEQSLVSPQVKRGFLPKEIPPEQPSEVQTILEHSLQYVIPFTVKWHSPRFFAYFPSQTAATSVLADMYLNAFHHCSDSKLEELENIVLQLAADGMGLPKQIKGCIQPSVSEAVVLSVHIAKVKALSNTSANKSYINVNQALQNKNESQCNILVGYYASTSHASSARALALKDVYNKREIPCNFYNGNYHLDCVKWEQVIQQDIKHNLRPFWAGLSYGTTFSCAVDLTPQVLAICKKYKIWLNLDAAYLGASWLLPQERPQPILLKEVDSMIINYSKQMNIGPQCALFYFKNEQDFDQGMCQHKKNIYNTVDIKDSLRVPCNEYSFGQEKRNCALKMYYFFCYYGLDFIQKELRLLRTKAAHLVKRITVDKQLFHLYAHVFTVVLFQVKGHLGTVDQHLTKEVGSKTKNIFQGFSSPVQFQGQNVLRIVVGNFNCQIQHIDQYYEKIKQVCTKMRSI